MLLFSVPFNFNKAHIYFSSLLSLHVGQSILLHTSSGSYTGKLEIGTGSPDFGEAGDIEILSGNAGVDHSDSTSGKISIATSPSPSNYGGDTGKWSNVSYHIFVPNNEC